MEAIIMATWRPESCEFEVTLGGQDCVRLETRTMCVWRNTWRLGSSEFGDAFGGPDRARLEEYWEGVNLEVVVREECAIAAKA
jgi:hypothetical protein